MKSFKSKVLFVCVLTLLLGITQISIGAPPANDNRQNAKSIGNIRIPMVCSCKSRVLRSS